MNHISANLNFAFWIFFSNVITFQTAEAQKHDSTLHFKGSISVTNNGFSLIPAFSLGKPAAMLEMAVGNKRISFEPQFRYSLEGKPWIFNFTYRYRIINSVKHQLIVGGNAPALNFASKTILDNGLQNEIQTVRRYLSSEFAYNYLLKKKSTIGVYYFQGYGLQAEGPRNMHYLSLKGGLTKKKICKLIYVDLVTQVFYLKVDEHDGLYANLFWALSIKEFPISISGILNKAIQSDVHAKDFDWNISVLYTIDKRFVKEGSRNK